MSKLSSADFETIQRLRVDFQHRLPGCESLEEAAQLVAQILFAEFADSLALVRLYATLPFRALPPADQTFVRTRAAALGVANQITPSTIVLTLLGTQGEDAAWNRRQTSEAHRGIPLVSPEFIKAAPMIARLLQELGITFDWGDTPQIQLSVESQANTFGVFYVPEAGAAVNEQGQHIIPAQEFVAVHQVRTVFGMASNYLFPRILLTLILFTHEHLERSTVDRFKVLPTLVIRSTTPQVTAGRLFAAGP
ncbi:MAG TPA: hypothetical protein VKY74_05280 [Chloroflexia bacterium]|nr:hypothetical protein [Chloroflexia bacterium]